MSEIVRCSNEEVASAFLSWLARQPANLRLCLLEGLPGAGKSVLGELLGSQGLRVVEVDKVITHPGDATITWVDRARTDGAVEHVWAAVAEGLTFVDGPAVWPLLLDLANTLGADAVRRVYIKQMSTSGGVIDWLAGRGLREHASAVEPFWQSIYGHHADQPWEQADLIIERVDDAAWDVGRRGAEAEG